MRENKHFKLQSSLKVVTVVGDIGSEGDISISLENWPDCANTQEGLSQSLNNLEANCP